MFGLWAKKQRTRWHMVTCAEDQDCLTTARKIARRAPGSDVLVDHIICQDVLTYATWRPVHQLTLEAERLQMARAAYIVRKLAKPAAILSFHTDALYFDSSSRKLRQAFETMTYKDLPGLKEHFEGFGRPSPFEAGVKEDPCDSSDLVFHFKANVQQKAPGWRAEELRQPSEDLSKSASSLAPRRGGQLFISAGAELELGASEWTVVDPEQRIAEGKSFLVDAPPVSEKAIFWARSRAWLEARGCSVAVLAPTNTAARRIGGATIHRFLIESRSAEWLLVDEYSMLSPDLCAGLEHLRCKIVLFGDRLQLPPVVNTWRGQPSKRLWESRLMGMWCDWGRVVLTSTGARRTAASATGLCRRRLQPLSLSVPDALARYPVYEQRRGLDALSSATSAGSAVNYQRQMREAATRGGTPMRLEGREVPLHVGTRLVAAWTQGPFVNGALLEFRGEGVGGKLPKYRLYDLDAKCEFQATRLAIERCCRLGWAMTIFRLAVARPPGSGPRARPSSSTSVRSTST
jgi:hypothetical protein